MLDIGWSELVVIGVVALVAIGPKDLPKALYAAGKYARKARRLTRELQDGVEELMRQAELGEIRREADKLMHGTTSPPMPGTDPYAVPMPAPPAALGAAASVEPAPVAAVVAGVSAEPLPVSGPPPAPTPASSEPQPAAAPSSPLPEKVGS